MLKEFLTNNIKIIDTVENWEESIKVSAKPLLDNGSIKQEYIQSMIDSVYKYGPYMVLTDYVAMPHARSEHGVVKTSMSFLKVRSGVDFYKTEKKVYLFFVLAAENSDGHQDAIVDLAEFLDDEEKLNKIIENDLTEDEILSLF